MQLQLFKEPYAEVAQPGVVRLLFEGAPASAPAAESCRDFYLYVWIRDGKHLDSFQAVLDEEFVLTCKPPAQPSFGRIGQEPLGRAVRESASPARRRKLARILAALHDQHFPSLVAGVGALQEGGGGPVELTKDEQRLLTALLKRRRR